MSTIGRWYNNQTPVAQIVMATVAAVWAVMLIPALLMAVILAVAL